MAKVNKVTVKGVAGDIVNTVSMLPKRLLDINAQKAEPRLDPDDFAVNKVAKALHPAKQELKITKVEAFSDDIKTFHFTWTGSQPLAYFRAGQYVSFVLKIGTSLVTRAFSLASSPKDALRGEYMVTIKRVPDGFVSGWVLDNWKEGDRVTAYAPEGNFCYEPLRDAPTVVGVVGGGGITPFLSMAKAIDEGTEDFNLTILYGARTRKELMFKDELDALAQRNEKINVVYVLSDAKSVPKGFEKGFIGAKLIKKHAPADGSKYSIFACGPEAMYNYLKSELPELGLERKYIRLEVFGVSANTEIPQEIKDKEFNMTVTVNGETRVIKANGSETVLCALERAGVPVPVRCRGGECGFCRSKVQSGEVFIPESADHRRIADAQFGYIHPCCCYPASDIELKIN